MASLPIFRVEQNIEGFARSLGLNIKLVDKKAAWWVYKLTRYAQKKMKQYARSKTQRSTGNLSNSIATKFFKEGGSYGGEAFVDPDVAYQFATEYGIKSRKLIEGKPTLAFPVSSWKKARWNKARKVKKLPASGYFIFSRVKRGKYKGRHFTSRAYDDLIKYYMRNEQDILVKIGQSILFSRG